MTRYSQQFTSTALLSADYDTEANTLDITFASGKRYTYENVPESIWDGLRDASSPGSYFFRNIKDRY
jgi:KTSC domain